MNIKQKVGIFILSILLLMSILAEVISGESPIIIKYENKFYFPIFKKYTYEDFNKESTLLVSFQDASFKKLVLDNNFVIFPILPYSPNTLDLTYKTISLNNINSKHILGTDAYGKDIFASLLYSLRNIFTLSIIIGGLSFLIGISFGIIQGYLGGIFDIILQRLYELFLAIPFIYIILFFDGLEKLNFLTFTALIITFNWTFIIPYVRSSTLIERNLPYIKTLEYLGVKKIPIAYKHLLPNILYKIRKIIPVALVSNIILLTNLEFLGMNFNFSAISFGELLYQNTYGEMSLLAIISSSITILIIVLAIFLTFSINDQ